RLSAAAYASRRRSPCRNIIAPHPIGRARARLIICTMKGTAAPPIPASMIGLRNIGGSFKTPSLRALLSPVAEKIDQAIHQRSVGGEAVQLDTQGGARLVQLALMPRKAVEIISPDHCRLAQSCRLSFQALKLSP